MGEYQRVIEQSNPRRRNSRMLPASEARERAMESGQKFPRVSEGRLRY